jgi:hypothetical protein
MRDVVRRTLVSLLAAVALGIVGGCGDNPPAVDTSNTEATVKGVVKVGGVPATEGEIVFDPANYQRKDASPRSAPIGKDGTYTVKTLTGTNTVRLGGSLAQKNQLLAHETRACEVKSGENTFDFEAKGDK